MNSERARARQDELRHAYEKMTHLDRRDRDGVVTTPVEIVDFINRAVTHALNNHFGVTLSSPRVESIIDPFAGTGIFAARMLTTCPQDHVSDIASKLQCMELDPHAADVAEANVREVIRGRGATPPAHQIVTCADTFEESSWPF